MSRDVAGPHHGSFIVPKVPATRRIVFKEALIFDGTLERPPFIGHLIIKGNLISEVLPRSTIVPHCEGDTVIDCQNGSYCLMPGMVDGHSHISFPDSYNFDIHPEEHTMITMHGARKLLDAGFTSAFSAASAKMRLDVVIRDEINAGRIPGPRLRAAGPELTSTGGLGDGKVIGVHVSNTFGYPADGPAEVTKAARLCVSHGVDNIKINVSGENFADDALSDVTTTYAAEELAAAKLVAVHTGRMLLTHSRGRESIRMAIDGGVNVMFHVEYADEESIQLLVKHKDKIFLGPSIGLLVKGGVPGSPSYGGGDGKPDAKLAHAIKVFRRLHQLAPDAKVFIGGDYGFPMTPQGTNANDIEYFVKYFGYTALEALRCATSVGGELMGMPVGRLQPGLLADVLLIKGNPTVDVTLLQKRDHIAVIIQDGWVYRSALPSLRSDRCCFHSHL